MNFWPNVSRNRVKALLDFLHSEFARSPLSLQQTPFSRSLRSTICDSGHPHLMRTLKITNGGQKRAKKTEFGGEREGR